MKTIDILHLKQQSPGIADALKQPGMYAFLRHEVADDYVTTVCVQCHKTGIILETPYLPGLCIDCLLALRKELETDPIEEPYRDKRSRFYDAKYDEQCKFWDDFYTVPDDYDGPPFLMAMA